MKRLKSRLGMLVGLGIVTSLVIGGIGWLETHNQGSSSEKLVNSVEAVRNQMLSDMMHDALRADVLNALYNSSNPAAKAEVTADTAEHAKTFIKALDDARHAVDNPAAQQAIDDVKPLVAQYGNLAQQLVAQAFEQPDVARQGLPAFLALFKELEGKNEKVSDTIEAAANQVRDEAHLSARNGLLVMLASTWIGAGLMLAVGWIIGRSVYLQIGAEPERARRALQKMAQGDLSPTLYRKLPAASLMESVVQLNQKWRDIIQALTAEADTLRVAADQVNGVSHQSATRSSQQGSATMEMAASIEQLSTSIQVIWETAFTVESTASRACLQTDEGVGTVRALSWGVKQISDILQTAAHSVQQLSDQSKQITEIVNVIKEIADQTNLLALNAAIEAARAGEQGRGFAVVADEVRKLAERTSNSTIEITNRVSQIQSNVTGAVSVIMSASNLAADGVGLADAAGSNIEDIHHGAVAVKSAVADIARTLQEQARGSETLAVSVAQLAELSEQSMDLAKQCADAAALVNASVNQLTVACHQFDF